MCSDRGGVLPAPQPVEDHVGVFLAEAAIFDRRAELDPRVPDANAANGGVELPQLVSTAQPLGFFFGQPPRRDHAVEARDNPLALLRVDRSSDVSVHGPEVIETDCLSQYSMLLVEAERTLGPCQSSGAKRSRPTGKR